MSFNIGDVVVLTSGGPRMTVNKVDQNGTLTKVECVWFDMNNGYWEGPYYKVFSPQSLKKDD